MLFEIQYIYKQSLNNLIILSQYEVLKQAINLLWNSKLMPFELFPQFVNTTSGQESRT